MKKISIITIHLGTNFGSILQTIATIDVFRKYNCESQVINYIPDRCTWKRYFGDACDSVIHIIKRCLASPLFIISNYIYDNFLAKHVRVSNPIYRKDDFIKNCPKADFYITGSDQVWNSNHNEGVDRHYFFDGFPEKIIKIAYSSSIGKEELDQDEYDEVKRMLASYNAISVREVSAKQLIEGMGYQVTHLIDPTLMLNVDDWKTYMSKRLIKEPYLIVYLPYNIHDKGLIYKTIKNISSKKSLKIVTFSWNFRNDKYADKTFKFANPGDFLSLMYYADFVVTNSFHGTAFSVNLNKQFYVYMPTGFTTRIMSILELSRLTDRLLNATEVISDSRVDEIIDYESVNVILDNERKKTDIFLSNALKVKNVF